MMTSSNKVRHLLEVVLQLLAVRNNAFVIPAASRVHIYEVLNSLADGTSSLSGDGAGLRMTQNFLVERESDRQWDDQVLITACRRIDGKADRQAGISESPSYLHFLTVP